MIGLRAEMQECAGLAQRIASNCAVTGSLGMIRGLECVRMQSRHAKFLKKAGRNLSWLAAAGLFISITEMQTRDVGALSLLYLSLITLAFGTILYLTFLCISERLSRRELNELLASGRLLGGRSRPLILFLRSFNVAKSGLLKRMISALGLLVWWEVDFLFTVAISRRSSTTQSVPADCS